MRGQRTGCELPEATGEYQTWRKERRMRKFYVLSVWFLLMGELTIFEAIVEIVERVGHWSLLLLRRKPWAVGLL